MTTRFSPRSWLDRVSESRWSIVVLLLVGVLLRLAWLRNAGGGSLSIGEALNVARSIADRGVIGDAFRVGQGPTAHVMPLPPLIAGGVYRLLGFQSSASNAVLTAWSLFLVGTAIWFFNLTFARLGSPPLARLAAVGILSLAPLNFSLEVVWFRVWDGGLAVAVASLFLYLLVTWDGKSLGIAQKVLFAITLALMCFVQPNFGIAGLVCAGIFMIRSLEIRAWPGAIAIFVAAAVGVFAPWTLRNAEVMGSPIMLRSNAGLEMALAFFPGALSDDPRRAFFERHRAIHPYEAGGGYSAMMRAGGEVAYARALGAETTTWMAAHPGKTVQLAGRHLQETLFPPPWYWTMFAERGSTATGPKLALNWLISAIGLIGICHALILLSSRWRYPVVMTLVTILPFMLVQPTLRYRYLIVPLLTFFATNLVGYLGQALKAQWLRQLGPAAP